MSRVIVVGAGISGLTAAWRLTEQGHEVTVLEAEPHVSGKIRSVERDGFRLHQGAALYGGSYKSVLALVGELGLKDRLTTPAPTVGIVRDGAPHYLRGEGLGALTDFVKTPLLSARSKLLLGRLARDTFRARKQATYENSAGRAELDVESAADYCDRRLNEELREQLIAPLLGAIWVLDGRALSVTDLYFVLADFMTGGVRGIRGGLDAVTRELASRLDVRTSAPVSLVERRPDHARVVWEGGDEEVDGVVLSLCAPDVPPVYPGLEPDLQGILLEGIEQAHYGVLRIALDERPEVDAAFLCVPNQEFPEFGAVVFDHCIHPDAAPPGKGLLSVFLNHEWASTRMDLPDDDWIEAVMPGLDSLVPGVAEQVRFVQVTRWEPATFKSSPGVYKKMDQLHQAFDDDRRVQHAGDYLSMATIEGAVVSGNVAAERLGRTLASAPV